MGLSFDTAANIINDAAVELGLAASTDVFASVDPNFVQLRYLLKSTGRKLRSLHNWSYLTNIYTFNTAANVASYALPVDYGSFISQSGWNRTNRLPLGGPLSPQEYEYFKARLVGVVFTVLFRVLQQNFTVYPDSATPGGYTIAYEYISRFWTVPSGTQATSGNWLPTTAYLLNSYWLNGGRIYKVTTAGTSGAFGPVGTGSGITDGTAVWAYQADAGSDSVTANGDTVLFESLLATRALKLAFLQAKGFDTTAAQQDFDQAFDLAKKDDVLAPVLNLSSSPFGGQLLGERNVPITGFGS